MNALMKVAVFGGAGALIYFLYQRSQRNTALRKQYEYALLDKATAYPFPLKYPTAKEQMEAKVREGLKPSVFNPISGLACDCIGDDLGSAPKGIAYLG